jgi:hypothetical protein
MDNKTPTGGSLGSSFLNGWAGQGAKRFFVYSAGRQNFSHRDRRGLFSIHTKYGPLGHCPKKVSFLFLAWSFMCCMLYRQGGDVTP